MTQLTRRRALALFAAPLVAAPFVAPGMLRAAEPAIYVKNGYALGGTDVVGYFTDSAPIQGSPDFAVDHGGATWLFASAASRDAFVADPERYLPAYGGYCAWAVSRNYTAPTIPEAWTIHNDRLYLNATLRTRRRWLREVDENIARADQNWPGVLG